MNRDRALQIVRHAAQQTNWPDNMVDVFVELGMLKIEQPETLAQRITECLCGPFTLSAAIRMQDLLHNADLKIVCAREQKHEDGQ